ncbi:hypothetical protein RHSIM_Rhsim04G0224100 [Rhododendron simsii]|uniref:Uncharacterized protein n=1 Tax=Rhododendron simsii TaxID=118357 RepID=A0A834LSJ2_RHOSS|nr:hypothetical protein RHSIM_Rhsim04G0224100 [Rhododendron simsii]
MAMAMAKLGWLAKRAREKERWNAGKMVGINNTLWNMCIFFFVSCARGSNGVREKRAYLAYHHEERHRGEYSPVLTPFLELEKGKSSGKCGTLSAVVGSTVFRIGGQLWRGGQGPRYSREVLYCRSPEEGWKTGPQTICGRSDAAVVALHEKIYVFGGHDDPQMYPEAVWGESLDTTFLTGGGQAAESWSRLPDPPSHLGFLRLFAAALDVHEFSGKILVGCTYTNDMCLYDVTQKSWETMDPLISGGGGSIVAH